METNCLVGETIIAIQLASDKKAIRFILSDGTDVVAETDGDCCSNSWIEHVELPASFPAVVIAVEDINMPDLGGSDDGNEICYYGCKITTDKGIIIIDYRNESNGYYGGSLVWPGESYYGGVYGQNESTLEWKDVEV